MSRSSVQIRKEARETPAHRRGLFIGMRSAAVPRVRKRAIRPADVLRQQKAIGDELKRRRMAARFTQQQLADQAGVERKSVMQLERGADLEMSIFIRCCMVLQATILPVGFDVVIPGSVDKRKPFDVV